MNVYLSDILTACILFPVVAFLITVPYMIYQYRRRGSVPKLHTAIVYSFVFYLMCAYFLVLLPLPADRTACVAYAATPQLAPFNFVHEFLAETTFSPSDPATWLRVLRDPYIYEAFFNVLLLLPLGAYLRYYFRRRWWQALIIGFLVTLSFETTQLTGLWGIYEHPYRLFDVDDLIQNTLGAMVGFWLAGPAMRTLPDLRTANLRAAEAGLSASVTRRALSFALDSALTAALAVGSIYLVYRSGLVAAPIGAKATAAQALEATTAQISDALLPARLCILIALVIVFFIVPVVTRGRTPAQALLHLRIVRTGARRASWYHYLARYGLLFVFIWIPWGLLTLLTEVGGSSIGSEAGTLATFASQNTEACIAVLAVFTVAWVVSLIVRGVRAASGRAPFVMLNGMLSRTRIMTESGLAAERARLSALSVDDVRKLEQLIAEGGISLASLMRCAGEAVADEVRTWAGGPVRVCVLTGSGNNGGDGWVCAESLARSGYPVTLITPKTAEELTAEPARTEARSSLKRTLEGEFPLTVAVAPEADDAARALDEAEVVVDAILGTGFTGSSLREPYATWISLANLRRFKGPRGKGRGAHRARTGKPSKRASGTTLRDRRKDAPFAVAVDVPSGYSAQAATWADPCFCADVTVTMLAMKPGLIASGAERFCGQVKLAELVDTAPYREKLG